MRLFQKGSYHSLDFGTGQARRLRVDLSQTVTPEMLQPVLREDGCIRSECDYVMNGGEVFNFAIRNDFFNFI